MAPPFELDDELKYIRLSMPVSCCSMTCVTARFGGVGARRPDSVALTPTCGGAMFGYDSTPQRADRDARRASVIRIAITQAKTGRSMKIAATWRVSPVGCALGGRRGGCGFAPDAASGFHGVAFAGCPGLRALHARHDDLVAVGQPVVTIQLPPRCSSVVDVLARDLAVAADDQHVRARAHRAARAGLRHERSVRAARRASARDVDVHAGQQALVGIGHASRATLTAPVAGSTDVVGEIERAADAVRRAVGQQSTLALSGSASVAAAGAARDAALELGRRSA